MPGRPSRLRFCSKWLGSAASPADGNIRNVRRSTADVERVDVAGPPVKMELNAMNTAPAPDGVSKNHEP